MTLALTILRSFFWHGWTGYDLQSNQYYSKLIILSENFTGNIIWWFSTFMLSVLCKCTTMLMFMFMFSQILREWFFSDSNGAKKITQVKDIDSRHHPMIQTFSLMNNGSHFRAPQSWRIVGFLSCKIWVKHSGLSSISHESTFRKNTNCLVDALYHGPWKSDESNILSYIKMSFHWSFQCSRHKVDISTYLNTKWAWYHNCSHTGNVISLVIMGKIENGWLCIQWL